MAEVKGRSIATAYVSLAFASQGLRNSLKKAVTDGVQGADVDEALSKDIDKGGKSGSSRLRRHLSGAASGLKKGVDTALRGAAKGAKIGGAAIGATLIAGVGTALTAGFARMSAIENANAKISGMGNSLETVQQVSKDALAAVKGTAYGIGDAASAAALAMAGGVKEGAELERYLKTVGNLATLSGAEFKDMGQILGKITANGRITGETLAQLEDRGFGASKALSEYFGVSQQEVRKMITANKVSAQDFLTAMEAYEGAALKSGETTKGAIANMMAAFGRLGESIMGDSFSLIRITANEIMGAIDGIAAVIKPAMEQINEDLVKNIGGGLDGAGERFAAFLMDNQDSITEFLLSSYESIKGIFSQIGEVFTNLDLTPTEAFDTVRTLVQDFITVTGQFLAAAVPLLGIIGEAGVKTILLFMDVLTQVMTLLLPMIEYLSNAWVNMSPEMQNVVSSIVAATVVIGTFMRFLVPVLGFVVKSFGKLGALFKGSAAGAGVFAKSLGWLKPLFGWVLKALPRVGAALAGIATGPVGWIITALSAVFLVVDAIIRKTIGWSAALKWVKDFLIFSAESLGTFMMAVLNPIWNFIKMIGNAIARVWNWNRNFNADKTPQGSGYRSFPVLDTGADVLGPTTVTLAKNGDPETVVNRGVMNNALAAITRDLKARDGESGQTNIVNNITNLSPAPGLSEREIAKMLYNRQQWNATV